MTKTDNKKTTFKFKNKINNKSFIGEANLKDVENAKKIKHPGIVKSFSRKKSFGGKYEAKPIVFLDFLRDSETQDVIGMSKVDLENETFTKINFGQQDEEYLVMNELICILEGISFWNAKMKKFTLTSTLGVWGKQEMNAFLSIFLKAAKLTEKEMLEATYRLGDSISGVWEWSSQSWTVKPIVEVKMKKRYGKKNEAYFIGIKNGFADTMELFLHKEEFDKETGELKRFEKTSVPVMNVSNFFQKKSLVEASENLRGFLKEDKLNESIEVIKNIKLSKEDVKYFGNKRGKEGIDLLYSQYFKEPKSESEVATNKIIDVASQRLELIRSLYTQLLKVLKFDDFLQIPFAFHTEGSIAEATLIRYLSNTKQYADGKAYEGNIADDINIFELIEKWETNNKLADIEKLVNLSVDSLGAGYIDIEIQGSATKENGFKSGLSDINKSYPAIILELPDLNDAVFETITEKRFEKLPTLKENEYRLMSAYVFIPQGVRNPFSVKEVISTHMEDNKKKAMVGKMGKRTARIHGSLLVSGLQEQYEYIIKKGGRVYSIEEGITIKTNGRKSCLHDFMKKLGEYRLKYAESNPDRAKMFKIIENAIYGKFLQTVEKNIWDDTKLEFDKREFIGLMAGAFFNPLYATMITSFARLRLLEMADAIEEKGAEIVMLLTDSVIFRWKGDKKITDFVPKRFESVLFRYKSLKENGYCEQNEKITGLFAYPVEFVEGYFIQVGTYEYLEEETLLGGLYEPKIMGVKLEGIDKKKSLFRTKLEESKEKGFKEFDKTTGMFYPIVKIESEVTVTADLVINEGLGLYSIGKKMPIVSERVLKTDGGRHQIGEVSIERILNEGIYTETEDYSNRFSKEQYEMAKELNDYSILEYHDSRLLSVRKHFKMKSVSKAKKTAQMAQNEALKQIEDVLNKSQKYKKLESKQIQNIFYRYMFIENREFVEKNGINADGVKAMIKGGSASDKIISGISILEGLGFKSHPFENMANTMNYDELPEIYKLSITDIKKGEHEAIKNYVKREK